MFSASSSSSSQPTNTQPSTADIPSNLQSLRSVVEQQGGEHLGDVVWWTLSGADVPRSVLENVWLNNGLDPAFLPEEQTPEKALRLAVRAAGIGLKQVLIRNTLEDKTALVYAVVNENPDSKGNANYAQEALVMLEKANGNIATDNSASEIAQRVIKEFHRYAQTHTSRDVMTSLIKALKAWKSVTLRDTGGIYWVPRTQSENLRKLRSAVEQLGDSRMYLLPVYKSDDAEKSLGAAAAGSIDADLAELREEITSFLADPDQVRPSTLERRLAAFEELRARASLYHSILSVTVQDLDSQLATMATSVQTMLAVKNA